METEYEGKSAEELVAMLQQKDADLKKAEEDKTATVGELKDLRQKKQEAEKALEEAKATKTEQQPVSNTAEEVERVLQQKAEAEAKQNRERALEDFKATNHEFSEASDPGGVKFAAFERELQKFNTSGLQTVEDFKSRFKEVSEFMNRGQVRRETNNPAPYEGGSRDTGGEPPAEGEHELDTREKKLLQQTGWTKERYLKLKEKQPQYVASQLDWMG